MLKYTPTILIITLFRLARYQYIINVCAGGCVCVCMCVWWCVDTACFDINIYVYVTFHLQIIKYKFLALTFNSQNF